jgi:kynurenine formamidase
MKRTLVLLTCFMVASACSPNATNHFSDGQWIDLTHDFGDDTIYWVNAEPFKRTSTAEGVTPGGFFYAAGNNAAAEHGGTHIDSPIHFAEGKNTSIRSASIN